MVIPFINLKMSKPKKQINNFQEPSGKIKHKKMRKLISRFLFVSFVFLDSVSLCSPRCLGAHCRSKVTDWLTESVNTCAGDLWKSKLWINGKSTRHIP